MTFTCVHTADWQIGKPFGTFPDDIAALLRDARLDAINVIAAVAMRAGAKHILVAGDIFDSATPPDRLLTQLLSRLQSHNTLIWHLLPGNHDPVETGGVWGRIATNRALGNVRLHLTPTAADLEPGVILLPAPVSAKAMSDDPSRWMDDHRSTRGTIRIGMAHGSVQGFGSEGEAQIPISPQRPQQADLSYLALGDWHGTKRIAERVWYSGTPEPDQFADNDPGHVLVVRVADAQAVPVIERIETRNNHWLTRTVTLQQSRDLGTLQREILQRGTAAQRTLLELKLNGMMGVTEAMGLNTAIGQLEGRLRYLKIDQTKLRFSARPADLLGFGDGAVTSIAQRLQRAVDIGGEAAGSAERALGLLARFVAAADRAP